MGTHERVLANASRALILGRKELEADAVGPSMPPATFLAQGTTALPTRIPQKDPRISRRLREGVRSRDNGGTASSPTVQRRCMSL